MRFVEGCVGALLLSLALMPLAAGVPQAKAGASPAGLVSRGQIAIFGDEAFTEANGVTGGNGTAGDPYIIEGWSIFAGNTNPLTIRNTRAPFIVRDVALERNYWDVGAVVVIDVWDGVLKNLTVTEPAYPVAVVIAYSNRVLLESSDLRTEEVSVTIDRSSNITVRGNFAQRGFQLTDSVNVVLERNTMEVRGISVDGSTAANFDSHTITPDNLLAGLPVGYHAHCDGLALDAASLVQLIVASCRSPSVTNLTLRGSDVAIHFAFVDGGFLMDNDVSETLSAGILITNSTGVVVGRNLLRNHTLFALRLVRSSRVLVTANDFLHNGYPGSDDAADNVWYSPLPEGGNYWSDYTGWDECGGTAPDPCGGPDGIGDLPYAVDVDTSDAYPRARPSTFANEPPVANFSQFVDRLYAREHGVFNATASYDPDGRIVEYRWNTGEGIYVTDSAFGYVWFEHEGAFNLTLTVVDDIGLKGRAVGMAIVEFPRTQPVAAFTVSASLAEASDPITFDASPSSDTRPLIEYRWTFGDGANATGKIVTHSFVVPGDYQVQLYVESEAHVGNAATQVIHVIEQVTYVPFEHTAGFRLPVPLGWSLVLDDPFEGGEIELQAFGPQWMSVQSNLIVETGIDPSVREDPAYQEGLVNELMDELSRSSPGAILLSPVESRTISGHAALSFAVSYPDQHLIQWFGIVLSEGHSRYWILLLSFHEDFDGVMENVFAVAFEGFEITLPPVPANVVGVPLVGLAVSVVMIAGALSIGLLLRSLSLGGRGRARQAPPFSAPPAAGITGTTISGPESACASCKYPLTDSSRFCPRCGRPIR